VAAEPLTGAQARRRGRTGLGLSSANLTASSTSSRTLSSSSLICRRGSVGYVTLPPTVRPPHRRPQGKPRAVGTHTGRSDWRSAAFAVARATSLSADHGDERRAAVPARDASAAPSPATKRSLLHAVTPSSARAPCQARAWRAPAARCAGARLLLRQDALLQRILLQLRQRIPRLRPRAPAIRCALLPDVHTSLT